MAKYLTSKWILKAILQIDRPGRTEPLERPVKAPFAQLIKVRRTRVPASTLDNVRRRLTWPLFAVLSATD